MAQVNASDLAHSIVAETVFGTTPTATATRYELPVSMDQEPLAASNTQIESNTKRPNRAGNISRQGMLTVEGSFDIRFQRHAFIDVLLQSALSNVYATNVLKGGVTDSSFSYLCKYSPTSIHAFGGCMVSGFSIAAKADGDVTSSWDILGSTAVQLTTDNPLAVTTVSAPEFAGEDVKTITIAGLTLDVVELNFSTKLDRTRRPKLGTSTSGTFGVNGVRENVVTVKAYRPDDFSVESGITGLAQAVSFDIGGTGAGYRFQLPTASVMRPKTTLGDGSAFIELEIRGGYDATAGTDLVVTRL